MLGARFVITLTTEHLSQQFEESGAAVNRPADLVLYRDAAAGLSNVLKLQTLFNSSPNSADPVIFKESS